MLPGCLGAEQVVNDNAGTAEKYSVSTAEKHTVSTAAKYTVSIPGERKETRPTVVAYACHPSALAD